MLIDVWDAVAGRFWRVAPKAEVAALENAYEGTVSGAAP
jgi:hypothetical protein